MLRQRLLLTLDLQPASNRSADRQNLQCTLRNKNYNSTIPYRVLSLFHQMKLNALKKLFYMTVSFLLTMPFSVEISSKSASD